MKKFRCTLSSTNKRKTINFSNEKLAKLPCKLKFHVCVEIYAHDHLLYICDCSSACTFNGLVLLIFNFSLLVFGDPWINLELSIYRKLRFPQMPFGENFAGETIFFLNNWRMFTWKQEEFAEFKPDLLKSRAAEKIQSLSRAILDLIQKV